MSEQMNNVFIKVGYDSIEKNYVAVLGLSVAALRKDNDATVISRGDTVAEALRAIADEVELIEEEQSDGKSTDED